MKLFALTLDLEADYAGCVGEYGIFQHPEAIEKILSALCAHGVKITVFAVGEIFRLHPEIIKIFEKYNCEFEPHSYTHIIGREDDVEITKAKAAYFDYFKKNPKGYRMPQGRITDTAICLLEKHGFIYDSSIFASYYPDPLKYLFRKRSPHCISGTKILEVPITSATPFRFTLSLSYLKLLGINFYLRLFKIFKLPDIICFNTHLHDFIVNEDSYNRLSKFWKFVYGRNKYSGAEICLKFLEYIKKKKYNFCYMSDIVRKYR